jgi:hypothetical protein
MKVGIGCDELANASKGRLADTKGVMRETKS